MKNELNGLQTRTERDAQYRWTAIILTILGLNIGMAIFAIFMAVGDPGLAVIERYKKDSFRFDDPIQVGQSQSAKSK